MDSKLRVTFMKPDGEIIDQRPDASSLLDKSTHQSTSLPLSYKVILNQQFKCGCVLIGTFIIRLWKGLPKQKYYFFFATPFCNFFKLPSRMSIVFIFSQFRMDMVQPIKTRLFSERPNCVKCIKRKRTILKGKT